MTGDSMVVRFLVIGILFALQTAYAASVGFDGIGTAMGVNSDISWDFGEARKEYFSRLKRQRLSQNDEPEIFEGYLTIVGHFAQQGTPAAKTELQNLIEKPTQARYQELLGELNRETRLFGGYLPPLKKNFGLSAIDLLERARTQIGKKFPSDVRGDMALTEDGFQKFSMINSLEDQVTSATHRIMSGSFGGKRKATLDERKTMVQFLMSTAQGIIDQGSDIEPVLPNYDLKHAGGAFNESMLKKHISICRTMLASMYYIVKKQVKVLNSDAEAAIKKLSVVAAGMPTVREVLKGTEIQALLKSKLGSFSLEEPVSVKKPVASSPMADPSGDDFKFKPENQSLYDRYVKNPTEFDRDITRDLEKYCPLPVPSWGESYDSMGKETAKKTEYDEKVKRRQGAINVINFVVTVQDPRLLDCINVTVDESGSSRPLPAFDGRPQDYTGKFFSFDYKKLNEAVEAKMSREGKTVRNLIWFYDLVSQDDVRSNKYNIATIRKNVQKIWKEFYKTLVYAYVFAKNQGIEKAFFSSIAQKEQHCTGSLLSPVTTWLGKEKEALRVENPTEKAKLKLSGTINELIQVDNFFIGNAIDGFILYWLAPEYLKWTKSQGHQTTLGEIEESPKDLLYLLPALEGKARKERLADSFSEDVAALIEKAVKERAIQDFQKLTRGHPVNYNSYDYDSCWFYFSTTDRDLKCAIKVKAGKGGYGQPKPTITDVEKVEVFEKYNKPLREYLREKFLEYFRTPYV